MPSQSDHLYKAQGNRKFVDTFLADAPIPTGWALTILFYSALHYVEAYNAKFNNHSAKHAQISEDIRSNPVLQPIYKDYRLLSNYSWNARYNSVKYGSAELLKALEAHTVVERYVFNLL